MGDSDVCGSQGNDRESSSSTIARPNPQSGLVKDKRQQAKQACQQCRQRKIKCDEARPECAPCLKAGSTCAYELPPGQSRTQAMSSVQRRLQGELQCHGSLIHTLRCADENHASRILILLRQGVYDGILLGSTSSLTGSNSSSQVYPWEEAMEEEQGQQVQGVPAFSSLGYFTTVLE